MSATRSFATLAETLADEPTAAASATVSVTKLPETPANALMDVPVVGRFAATAAEYKRHAMALLPARKTPSVKYFLSCNQGAINMLSRCDQGTIKVE